MEKRTKWLIIIGILLVLTISLGLSYSFYIPNLIENNKSETVIETNELGLVYTGVKEIKGTDIIPGNSFEKTFTVENTSTIPVTYNIYIEKVDNQFDEYLVYSLYDDNGKVIDESPLPITKTGKSYLKLGISIDSGEIKNYKLKIEYKYLENERQSNTMGAEFKGTLGVDTEQINTTFSISGILRKVEDENTTSLITNGNIVFYSKKQDIMVTSDGFSVRNLEYGTHEAYYMGDIDSTNMTKEEIKNQALCKLIFNDEINGTVLMNCKEDSPTIKIADISLNESR